MNNIKITHLFTYPVKSTTGIALTESEVVPLGLKYDRTFAIIGADNHIITGRENQKMLSISSKRTANKLLLSSLENENVEFDLETISETKQEEVFMFNKPIGALVKSHQVNDWISSILGEKCRLITIEKNIKRRVKAKYQGREDDFIAFPDAGPICFFSEASLAHLNTQLERPVTPHNFRPNIVISGCEAFEEDTWNRIKIGECEFDVTVKTGRCVFITIDPKTYQKDPEAEPLKTLAKTRTENNKVMFGMYLIPRKYGRISVNDRVQIIR